MNSDPSHFTTTMQSLSQSLTKRLRAVGYAGDPLLPDALWWLHGQGLDVSLFEVTPRQSRPRVSDASSGDLLHFGHAVSAPGRAYLHAIRAACTILALRRAESNNPH